MALFKNIIQEDGVPTNYHRILLTQLVINSHTSISVLSYVNQSSRQGESGGANPYKASVTYETDYIENLSIEDAYKYLKTLPQFEGAEDV